MYSILLIDDDATSRISLKTMIDWEQNGFQIIGEAVNGEQGLQLIEKYQPDVVITDMHMPVLDGTGVIDWLSRNKPLTCLLVLSGYEDFQYLKSSMNGGAIDYLLKHNINESLLKEVIEKIKQKLENQEIIAIEHEKALEHTMNQKKYDRDEMFRSMLEGPYEQFKLSYLNLINDDLKKQIQNSRMVIIEIDDFKHYQLCSNEVEVRKLTEMVSDIIQQIVNDYNNIEILMVKGNRFAILISFGREYSTLNVYNQIYRSVDRIQKTIKRYLNMTASVAVSPLISGIENVNEIYQTTNSFFHNKLYEGKNKIFMTEEMIVPINQMSTLTLEQDRKLQNLLLTGQLQEAHIFLGSIFSEMKQQRISHKSVLMIGSEIIRLCNVVAQKYNIQISEVYNSIETPYQLLAQFETMSDIEGWISSVVDNLMNQVNAKMPSQHYSSAIQGALEFIHKNYQNDISLKDVAEVVGVSSSHLSRLFKIECENNYVKYLNELRVEQSKKLIEEGNLKLKEVVTKVGFQNYNYFFKVFKDYTGLTPLAYEDMIQIKKNE